MADNITGNPWKGLNFYTEGEILYGRSAEIVSLSQYIFNNTQTVLYGRSGIGKSSILNAGIFPKARLHGMLPVSIRLKHGDSNDYLAQIRDALTSAGLIVKEIIPPISGADESLWEFMHRHIFVDHDGEARVPLLVFDQFEEIFTLQTSEAVKRDFFRQLGDLLNDVKPSYIVEHESRLRQQNSAQEQETTVVSSGVFKGLNLKINKRRADSDADDASRLRYISRPDYHIVFALREDFLSSLELYTASIPVMKDNRFGLLPLNEEQAADIIQLPRPGLVGDDVARLIIEQVTGRSDFQIDGVPEIEVDAAVLSLFLSRLYIKKPADESAITADLVSTYSGHIIHDFYLESIASDPDHGQAISQSTILTLEDRLLTGEGRRNNVSRSDLVALGVSDSELDVLIDKRKLLRQFNHGNDIRIEYIHDILCPVVSERRERREQLRLQEAERERQEIEKQRIIDEAEARARRVRQRNRRVFTWCAMAAGVLLAIGTYFWYRDIYLPSEVHEKFFSSFELVNGWPVGVGELTEQQRASSPIYYRLSHIGTGSHDTDVEVMSSNSMLPSDVRLAHWPEVCEDDADAKGQQFNEILSRVRKLHFSATEGNSKVDKIELRGDNDAPLMFMNFFHLNDREAWLSFVSPAGQAMPIRDNGIDRVKMSWDSLGRVEYQRYYTSFGVAKPIHEARKIAGYYRHYPEENPHAIDYYTLNIYGLPGSQMAYNLKRVATWPDSTVTEYFKAAAVDSENPAQAVGEHGYSRVVARGNEEALYMPGNPRPVATSLTETDSHGNPVRQTIRGSVNDSLPPVIEWDYKGDTGLLAEKRYLSLDGAPFGRSDDDIFRWEKQYDEAGNLISERRFSTDGREMFSRVKSTSRSGDTSVISDVMTDSALGVRSTTVDSVAPGRRSTSFFTDAGVAVNRMVPFGVTDSVSCHRMVVEEAPGCRSYKFYAYNPSVGDVAPIPTAVNDKSLRATSFCRREYFDDKGNLTNMEILDSKGDVVKRMKYFIQNGETIGRSVWGVTGESVRCPRWEEEAFGYYKIYYSKDFDNTYVFLQPFDEWMNSSVFANDNAYVVVRPIDLVSKKIRSADGSFLSDITVLKSLTVPMFKVDDSVSSTELPYLHILSTESPLLKADLRDGDRIVRLGSWSVGGSQAAFARQWQALSRGAKDMTLTVARPGALGYTFIDRPVAARAEAPDLAAEYHFLKLSKAEKSFYDQAK